MDHTKLTAIDDADAYTMSAHLPTYSELVEMAQRLVGIGFHHVHGHANADRAELDRAARVLAIFNKE